MGSWLRNIQGQLSDLANEVLSEANDVLAEAREEVADPDTELIVAKKKAAEAEKQLAIESARASSLEDEKKDLEQQLYDAHVEMDTIGQKLNGMVRQRDEEIKKLKNQLEQLQESGWGADTSSAPVPSQSASEDVEARLEEARHQKEREIQALIESHAESMIELREMYEEKMAQMQVLPVSSSTSNADTLDAVMVERGEDLIAKSSTNGSDLGDRPVVLDLGSHDELVDERIRQVEAELERCREEKNELQTKSDATVESLRSQNEELARAYDELNTEFEQFKERNTVTESRNNDLNHRIDSLKASLIEYEERYELCKKENLETVGQLERLTADFERLRTGVASVSQRREDCDQMVDEEVAKLRNALDESRSERERLRDDMQRFQTAVAEIDVELEKLRAANRALLGENEALTQNLATYDETMKDIISNSERDIGHFREQFHDIQDNHKKQREAVLAENEALREETEAVKAQRDILVEESKLLKEVNERLKQKSASEENKMELMATKIELLEQVLVEERAERAEKLEKEKEEGKSEETKEKDDDDGQIDVLKAQLREALDANAEKSEECERIRIESRNLEREIDLRQNCVDEMIAQTNTLQMQQETMSAANKTLQTQLLANERTIVQLGDEIRELKALVADDGEKIGRLQDTIENSTGDETQSRYLGQMKERIEVLEAELREVKESKMDESIEAEQVRKNLERDLFEAEEVDRGLLEGIESRVREMEAQLIDKVQSLETARQEARTMKERIKELEEQQTKTDVLAEQNELLTRMVDRLKEEAESAKNNGVDTEQLQNSLAAVQEEARNNAASLEELRQTAATLQQENEYLKTVAKTHHDENVKYYEQCQAMAMQSQQLQNRILELEASSESSDSKKAKELQRLREHLMIVEENSTREAVEAEQRETELRARVRELEARGHAVQEGATESTQQYQVQIAALSSKLESVEKASAEWKGRFESETRVREQTQEALASLQNVVRELSVDHERDAAAASHRNLELQGQIATLSEEIAQIREELDRQSIGRQAAEEETDRRQLQLDSKQKIIEDLEVQIEELRSPTRAGTADSYRIDDSTLRQLFLNYFTAEPAKRADIAMLLGSILEYPADEMDKFRSAIRQSFQSSSSSFFFGSRGSSPPSTSSISEQFIRFLEVESESSRTAPHLPVRNASDNSGQMSLDSPRQKSSSSPQPPSSSSSAAALDSLLR